MLHTPPFGKGRVGGILQNNVFIILRLLIIKLPSFGKYIKGMGLPYMMRTSEMQMIVYCKKKGGSRSRLFRILTRTLECEIHAVNNLGHVLRIHGVHHIVIEAAWIKPACLYKICEVLCELP
jgi:hypothetical protein